MKIFLLAAFCFSTFVTAMAQTIPKTLKVKGIAIDSATAKPVSYATVALTDAATKKSVRGTLTKDDGSFELKAPAGKAYQLVFAVVGYAPKSINIKETETDLNLGRIILLPAKNQLKEVSITAQRPILKQEVDRITYDVQADPESVAITALDMMRKVPLLSVDGNENILLKGSGNYKILINGKESALVAKNPSEVLKSMPATNIERIEVITTPPAKYDAEGLAGIINIITKKNADQGYNANINGRYNSAYGPALNISANAKQGKFGISMFMGDNEEKSFNSAFGNQQNFTDGQAISQTGTNFNGGTHKYIFSEFSYEIDSLNLISGSFGTYFGRNSQNNTLMSKSTAADTLNQQYQQAETGYNKYQGLDASINYQIGFKRNKDQLLTLSYKFSYSPFSQNLDNIYSDRVYYPESEQPDFLQNSTSGAREHTIQIDYAEPFKKITLEAGGKVILRDNFSNFQRSDKDSTTGQYNLNPIYTDVFNYHQDVYSLYNSYQLKLEKWSAKIGLRLEHTAINADFLAGAEPVSPSYNNLIPSISVLRSFKTSSFNLGFTQRIQRPSIYQLNPFVDTSNPLFISTGNPNLRPELNNTFEFTYSNFAKNSFNIGVSYAFSNNSIQNVSSLLKDTLPNSQVETITKTTYENLGSNSTLGLNVNTNLSITKRLSVNLNGRLSYIWLKGTFNGEFYQNSGLTGNAFANIGYKFNDRYRLSSDIGFFSGDVNLQGSSSDFIYNSLVFTTTFLNKKATISLVANDPETKYHNNTSNTTTPEYTQYSYNYNPYRNYAIRFSYKFGKLNSEIKKNQHGINNDDTKGGGKGGNSGG